MKRSRSFILLGFFMMAACGSTSETVGQQTFSTVSGPGDYDRVITSGGLDRSYLLHVPAGYDGSKSQHSK